jgi:copper(I)-binding protein
MVVDWIATLQEQLDLVMKVAKDVANALDASDLTVEQAFRLYRMVELQAQDFDRIVEFINDEDLEKRIINAAETIEDTWTNLSVATANKLRAMRGLDPIDIAADNQNNA